MNSSTRRATYTRRALALGMTAFWLTTAGCSPDDASTANNDHQPEDAVSFTDVDDTQEQWTWNPVENSKCGNGSTAGYGLLPRHDSTKLVLYFNGGGACWDAASCYVFNAATNIEVDYSEAHFRNEVGNVGSNDFFGGASFAFFPYCTADLHAGDSIGQYDALKPDRKVHHNGAVNTALYLERLKQQYPNVKTLHVLGISAGGYGAMLNYEKIREVFDDAEIHVLADSSPFVQPREGRWSAWKTAWNMQLPADCDACALGMPEVASHIIQKYPDSRFGLLSWEDDATITIFFAYGFGELGSAVRALAADAYAHPNASTFLVEGTDHVMLVRSPTLKATNGQTLGEYLNQWAYP